VYQKVFTGIREPDQVDYLQRRLCLQKRTQDPAILSRKLTTAYLKLTSGGLKLTIGGLKLTSLCDHRRGLTRSLTPKRQPPTGALTLPRTNSFACFTRLSFLMIRNYTFCFAACVAKVLAACSARLRPKSAKVCGAHTNSFSYTCRPQAGTKLETISAKVCGAHANSFSYTCRPQAGTKLETISAKVCGAHADSFSYTCRPQAGTCRISTDRRPKRVEHARQVTTCPIPGFFFTSFSQQKTGSR